jgi:hypothetical protein
LSLFGRPFWVIYPKLRWVLAIHQKQSLCQSSIDFAAVLFFGRYVDPSTIELRLIFDSYLDLGCPAGALRSDARGLISGGGMLRILK